MLGLEMCHEITYAVYVGIALTTRWITYGTTYYIHLGSTIPLALVDVAIYACLELICTFRVAPVLIKTCQFAGLD